MSARRDGVRVPAAMQCGSGEWIRVGDLVEFPYRNRHRSGRVVGFTGNELVWVRYRNDRGREVQTTHIPRELRLLVQDTLFDLDGRP